MACLAVKGDDWYFAGDAIDLKTIPVTPTILSQYSRDAVAGWNISKVGSLPHFSLVEQTYGNGTYPYSVFVDEDQLALPGPAVPNLIMKANVDVAVVFEVQVSTTAGALAAARAASSTFVTYDPSGTYLDSIDSPCNGSVPSIVDETFSQAFSTTFSIRKNCAFFPFMQSLASQSDDVFTIESVKMTCIEIK